MKLAIAKLPEFWRGITRNRDIERSAREWMEGYDAALAYCAEQLDQALSHAAGQEMEPIAWLCRERDGRDEPSVTLKKPGNSQWIEREPYHGTIVGYWEAVPLYAVARSEGEG